MFDENELKQNKSDFKQQNLVEITDIKIDTELNDDMRIKSYLEQIKNPYCFLCHDVVVNISFSEQGEEFSQLLKRYMSRQ